MKKKGGGKKEGIATFFFQIQLLIFRWLKCPATDDQKWKETKTTNGK